MSIDHVALYPRLGMFLGGDMVEDQTTSTQEHIASKRNGVFLDAFLFIRTRMGLAMQVCEQDRTIVQWAVEHGYLFHYAHPPMLPRPCLEVRIGYSTAYFHEGKLVRLVAVADGGDIDQLMYELTHLFAVCRHEDAYLPQRPFLQHIDRVRRESA